MHVKPKYVSTRTPLRVSFAGGGTDLPAYYREHGGSVINSAINQYVYVTVKRHSGLFGEKYRLNYSSTEHVQDLDDISNGIARECIRLTGVDSPLNIATSADVPASSGLGSSSSFAVGLLHALHTMKGETVSPFQLAEEACYVELEALGNRIGKQDQYAAAFGGLNHFIFEKSGRVLVDGMHSPNGFTKFVFENLLLVWSGVQRNATNILEDQSSRVSLNLEGYASLIKLVTRCKDIFLQQGDDSLRDLGDILEFSWSLKRNLSELIKLDHLDSVLGALKKCGSYGGKVSGAGGGGFILVVIEKHRHQDVIDALGVNSVLKIDFESRGSEVISIVY